MTIPADKDPVPEHSPGCKPTGMASRRFPGEPRYVCAANCPRRVFLARLDNQLKPSGGVA